MLKIVSIMFEERVVVVSTSYVSRVSNNSSVVNGNYDNPLGIH